jgi:Family of unknown function (DUF6163)
MSDPLHALDPQAAADSEAPWTRWLILYVRALAVLSMLKGLYHWSLVVGVGDGADSTFELAPMSWKAATVFFAIIDLVAAVGLWLAAVWGGVVWLTAASSMAAVEIVFPQIYGGQIWVVLLEVAAIAGYLGLAIMAARERPD